MIDWLTLSIHNRLKTMKCCHNAFGLKENTAALRTIWNQGAGVGRMKQVHSLLQLVQVLICKVHRRIDALGHGRPHRHQVDE